MRGRFAFVAVVVLVGGATVPLGASTFAQRCEGPPSSTESGRAAFVPGVNRLSTAQHVTVKISLFGCSPARSTRGAGTLRTIITPRGTQTCSLFSTRTVWKTAGAIVWKDTKTSTLALTVTLTSVRLINVAGTVTSGLFKNHPLTGQLRYLEVVSFSGGHRQGDPVSEACANKIAPHKPGRIAITAINLFTTRHFIVY